MHIVRGFGNFEGSGNFLPPESIIPASEMNDEEIVAGCLAGERIAQRALYDTYSRKMMGICLRYAKDRDEAKDILQDGFIKVFQKLGSYSGTGALGGWMARTMVNTALDHIRRNKHSKYALDIEEVEYLAPEEAEALSSLGTQELLKLIQALPTGYRTVFNMFAIEGYSHKEIADELNISENTSKSQFRKAKAYLRRSIPSRETTQ